MAKFKLNVIETKIFNHKMVVEAEDGLDILNSLDKISENVKAINIKKCTDYLENDGIKVLDLTEAEKWESFFDCDEIERTKQLRDE